MSTSEIKKQIRELANAGEHKKTPAKTLTIDFAELERHTVKFDLPSFNIDPELLAGLKALAKGPNSEKIEQAQQVVPISHVHFRQEAFITRENLRQQSSVSWSHWGLNYSKTPKPWLTPSGICAGLVMLWYDALRNNSNLLNTLHKNDLPEYFIHHLQKVHEHTTWSSFKNSKHVQKNPDEKTASSGYVDRQQEVFYKMGYLDSVQADATMHDPDLDQIEQLNNYFNQLERYDKECVGLHTITTCYKDRETQEEKPHIIAWTATQDHYLLFDPDIGELVFKNYDDLKYYISDKYFSADRLESFFVFNTDNFYFEEDLAALNQCDSTNKLTY